MGRLVPALAAAAALVAAVALTQSGSGAAPRSDAAVGPPPARAPRVSCKGVVRQRIDKPDRLDMVVGPAELQGARARAGDHPETYVRRHGRDPTAKVPVILEPRTRLLLAIDPRDRRGARLTFRESTRNARRVADGHAALRFASCFPDVRNGWAGGFIIDGPRCVRVLLYVNGSQEPVRRTLRFARRRC